jgi:hypothetical protein
MAAEVVFNLWLFVQPVGPMQIIHELGVRPYMMSGSDDEMTQLLKELSASDFHFARRFRLPDRYYVEMEEKDGVFRASSGDFGPTGKNVKKGLALVRPDISGMNQLEYFKEALDAIEKELPRRPLGLKGGVAPVPPVNRKNLLSVITTVIVSADGKQAARLPNPAKSGKPETALCLWAFNDQSTGSIYAVSGRGYMIHGSTADRDRILKALAPNDFRLAETFAVTQPARILGANCDSSLFESVFAAVDQGIPERTGIGGKFKNTVSFRSAQSSCHAVKVTERSGAEAGISLLEISKISPPRTTPVNKVGPEVAAAQSNQVVPQNQNSSTVKKPFLQRLFGK